MHKIVALVFSLNKYGREYTSPQHDTITVISKLAKIEV